MGAMGKDVLMIGRISMIMVTDMLSAQSCINLVWDMKTDVIWCCIKYTCAADIVLWPGPLWTSERLLQIYRTPAGVNIVL